jgi:hypothetical protein
MTETVHSGMIVDQRELIAGIREYLSEPQRLNGGFTSFSSVATHFGCSVDKLHQCMAQNPEIGSEILQSVAMSGSLHIPRILFKLMEAIEHGSIKAAEIYLDFVRKTIQDPQIAQMNNKSQQDLTAVMGSVGSSIEMLLGAAQQSSPEAARQMLSSPVSRTAKGAAARAEIAILADPRIPKASDIEAQT